MALPTPDEAHRDLDRIIGFISNSDNKDGNNSGVVDSSNDSGGKTS